MSWGFQVAGKPKAVAAKARAEAEIARCAEPEESIRKNALNTIATIADNTADEYPIEVAANGSQSVANGVVQHNSLHISVKPIWNWAE